MRPAFLFLLGAASAWAQPFSFGLKAGVPLTDFLNAAGNGRIDYSTATNRYILGVGGLLRLPFGLGVEADALYRHLNYQETQPGADTYTSSQTTANAFEFPILVRYQFRTKLLHPFIDGGVAFDTLQGVKQAVTSIVLPSTTRQASASNPSELHNNTTRGFVLGGGLDIKLPLVHIEPEIRFTRWGAQHFFDPNGLLHTNQSQGEFLLGISF